MLLYRHIRTEVLAFLKIMPVVLICGARQTGKTTLAESIMGKDRWTYVTFDDEITLSLARKDPSSWLASQPKPLVIDEVQRVPEIFLSIKRDVDKNRQPGRYLLTGSANPLLLPRLGDSLAGRMGIVTMYPFSQGELHQTNEHFISQVFNEGPLPTKDLKLSQDDLIEILLRGGFPAVRTFTDLADIRRWVGAYLQTMMQKDVKDISNIEGIHEFPRLFRLIATRSANLLNISDLSRSLGIVNMTLNRYLKLLETLFFIHLLPAWFTNKGKRLIKSPKVHLCDTAIMAQLLEINSEGLKSDPYLFGQFLETLTFSELLKQKSWSSIQCELYHFRDGDYEVDFVLEKPDQSIVGIEVKRAQKIRSDDLKGLNHLKQLTKSHFKKGIILYLGNEVHHFDKNLMALPLQSLWF